MDLARSLRVCLRPTAKQARRLKGRRGGTSIGTYEDKLMTDLQKIVDELSGLTVLEAAELAKMLEEKWGVSAAAPVAMMAAGGGAAAAAPAEEKTEFTVVLAAAGAQK